MKDKHTEAHVRAVLSKLGVVAPVRQAPSVSQTTWVVNAERNGVELRFPAKPDDGILDHMKASGWRWSRFGKCWYCHDTAQAREYATRICELYPMGTGTKPEPKPKIEVPAVINPPVASDMAKRFDATEVLA